MKKMSKRKGILIAGLVGVAGALSCLAIMPISASANVEGFSNFAITEEMQYNSVFELPDVTYSVGDKTVTARGELTYPNGEISTTNKNVLNVAGDYQLTYYAKVDGTVYEETEEFTVQAKNYYVNNAMSAISVSEYNGVSGLDCDMVCGDTLSFSPIIDLRTVTKTTSLFELFIIPSAPHTVDFAMMDIFLTDIYDETNKLQVCITPYDLDPAGSYVKVRATNTSQPLTGIYDNGVTIAVHRNDQYGAPLNFGFAPTDNYEKKTFSLAYDITENKAYSNYHTPLIADLDDYAHFTELWSGFTTGEVRLSIVPKNGTRAHFFMKSVLGVNFATTEYVDDEAPVLNVDVDETQALPTAIVGYPYPVFAASAFDYFSGAADVSVSVWKNYYSNARTNVELKDGKFTPSKAGLYTIEYITTDYFGNSTTKRFDITAEDDGNAPFNVTVSDPTTNGLMGLKTNFGQFSSTGGIGEVEYKVEVYYDGEQIDTEKDGFIPLNLGEYTVKVIATDYLSRQTETSYTVQIAPNEQPVIYDVQLLKYMTVGRSYDLPIPVAMDYSEEMTELQVDVSVINGEGEEKKIEGNVYTPDKADGNKTIVIRYTAKGKLGTTTKDYPVKIRDVKTEEGKLNISQYFYTENVVAVETTKTHVSYKANNDSFLEFVNPLLSGVFSVEFALDDTNETNGTTELYLTNKDDSEQQIAIAIDRNGTMTVNGSTYAIEFAVTKVGRKSVTVSYSALSGELDVNGTIIRLTKWQNGSAYKGFDGDMLWLSFEFSGYADGINEDLRIGAVGGQSFNSNTVSDRVRPIIVELGEYGGVNQINDTVKILDILYADVLNDCEATVSVIAPNGDYVVALDGTNLKNVLYSADYEFICEQFGVYSVEIVVKDSAGAKRVLDYVVNVFNTIGPEIESEGVLYQYLTVGDFEIPSVIVTDESTSSENIRLYVSLIDKDGILRRVEIGEKITLTKGVYTLQYMAIDTDNNVSFFNYTFSVEG